MTLCSAVDCKNTGIHIFPKDIKRRKQWIKALRRKNWEPTKYSRLCADHFKPDDYFKKNSYTGDENKHKVLKKDAVPSIFSFTKMKVANPLAQQRSDRLQERSRKKVFFETADDPIPVCHQSGSSGIQSKNSSNILQKCIEATGRENWSPTKNSVVCSLHLSDSHYTNSEKLHRFLARNAVPTENVFYRSDNCTNNLETAKNSVLSPIVSKVETKEPAAKDVGEITRGDEELTPNADELKIAISSAVEVRSDPLSDNLVPYIKTTPLRPKHRA